MNSNYENGDFVDIHNVLPSSVGSYRKVTEKEIESIRNGALHYANIKALHENRKR